MAVDPRQTFDLKAGEGEQVFKCRYMTRAEVRQFRQVMTEATKLEFSGENEKADALLVEALTIPLGSAFAPVAVKALESMTEFEVMEFLNSIETAQWLSEEQRKNSASPSQSVMGFSASPTAAASATPATTPTA